MLPPLRRPFKRVLAPEATSHWEDQIRSFAVIYSTLLDALPASFASPVLQVFVAHWKLAVALKFAENHQFQLSQPIYKKKLGKGK
jgi:hypothetical protein